MKLILNAIILLEIISVMCVRHTASFFKITIVEDPSQNIINAPQKKDNDGETPDRRRAAACPPVGTKQNVNKKTAGTGWPWQFSVMRSNL